MDEIKIGDEFSFNGIKFTILEFEKDVAFENGLFAKCYAHGFGETYISLEDIYKCVKC